MVLATEAHLSGNNGFKKARRPRGRSDCKLVANRETSMDAACSSSSIRTGWYLYMKRRTKSALKAFCYWTCFQVIPDCLWQHFSQTPQRIPAHSARIPPHAVDGSLSRLQKSLICPVLSSLPGFCSIRWIHKANSKASLQVCAESLS